MNYHVYKLQNPEDFKGLGDATIRPLDPYSGGCKLYILEFNWDDRSERGYSRSVDYLKMCMRREWRDELHKGKRMKWKKYLWHKNEEIEI